MTENVATRINQAAAALKAAPRVSKKVERRRERAYIRSTKELDPSTPLSVTARRSALPR
jgi:hypothetical protein